MLQGALLLCIPLLTIALPRSLRLPLSLLYPLLFSFLPCSGWDLRRAAVALSLIHMTLRVTQAWHLTAQGPTLDPSEGPYCNRPLAGFTSGSLSLHLSTALNTETLLSVFTPSALMSGITTLSEKCILPLSIPFYSFISPVFYWKGRTGGEKKISIVGRGGKADEV